MAEPRHAPTSALRRFLEAESSGGLVLMGAAALALVIANTPLNGAYEAVLHAHLGPLPLLEWINDGLMAFFFLFVGMEIKREAIDGQLATWPRRALPGLAAAGGMLVPAIVFLLLNPAATSHGWAIPTATDIAFALGVLSLLGKRVPASLRVFLAALAIIDDLGAVAIIAVFYTGGLSVPDLAAAAAVIAVLAAMNRFGVLKLWPYLALGAVLWVLMLRSGVHATLAGVFLALTIPLRHRVAAPDDEALSPLHRLEHALATPVSFIIVPLFGLANAGVPFLNLPAEALAAPVTLGVGLGLLIGKAVGVFAAAILAIRLGLADMPAYASRTQLFGTALLCGIGFTMSLFVTLLAFPGNELLQAEAKIGILGGSFLSGLLGYALLRVARGDFPPTPSR
ncbi:Na+/H+ antiporter NhaA [Roseomonas sp. KE2513]|uniref:Na+/H+ antiporter NhaA n=1 Tax=Roseomonas sp. KE2513 TaxID=2479202 RepID=UPI0018DF1852|nr:Na+/H+ antiporter NhaA [Roseomonas sp. KE2513]MBI0535478.1 Na+/H+ antiporter NhaA [Roseomonas sp. KE2513]